MAFDYKKEYREFYLPKERPEIVTVPPMNYIAVRGKGDPNIEDGEYQAAMGMLYGVAFTIKMSKKGSHCIKGYFDYVVPPLEGFWWQEGIDGVDFAHKDEFNWISVIRLPDFVTKEDFHWAVEEAAKKKKRDFSKAEQTITKAIQEMGLPEADYFMEEFLPSYGLTIEEQDYTREAGLKFSESSQMVFSKVLPEKSRRRKKG